MGCGDNKLKHSCGELINALCVKYQGDIPEFSSIDENNCPVVVEEVLDDMYELLAETKVDFTKLGCLEYETDLTEINLEEVLLKFETEICTLKEALEETDTDTDTEPTEDPLDFSITDLGLDLECLVDPCGEQITNFKPLIQTIITKLCSLCTSIDEIKMELGLDETEGIV